MKNQSKNKIFPEDFFEKTPEIKKFSKNNHLNQFYRDLPLKKNIDNMLKYDSNKIEPVSLQRKPCSAYSDLKKNDIQKKPLSLRKIQTNNKILKTESEDEGNKFIKFSSHNNLKSSNDKFSNLDYILKSDFLINDEEKLRILDSTPDKSLESNYEVSTSGSYNNLSKINNKPIFRFDNLDENLDLNKLKQTACFSTVPNKDENINNKITNKHNAFEIETRVNDKFFIKEINSCPTISSESHESKYSKIMSSDKQCDNLSNVNFNNFRQAKRKSVSRKNTPNEGQNIQDISHKFPKLSSFKTSRNPDCLEFEFKNVLNAAQKFQEDPVIKKKLNCLMKNIFEIKNVLQSKK